MNFKVVERKSVKGEPILYFYSEEKYLGGVFFGDVASCEAFKDVLVFGTSDRVAIHGFEFVEGAPQQKSVS